jgi:hypothetical protein
MAFSFEVQPDEDFDLEDDVVNLAGDRDVNDEDSDGEVGFAEYEGLFDEEDFIALGINPAQPTNAKPGSDDKVLMLAARYAAGLPLWHDSDRYDHGPGEPALQF